jgi:hypothetical protein
MKSNDHPNKRMTFAVDIGEGEDVVFTLDMTEGVAPDGKLTDAGRNSLQAQMLAALGPKVEPGQLEGLEKAIDTLLDGAQGKTLFDLSSKTIVELLTRMVDRLEDMPNAVRALAVGLSIDEPLGCHPNMYALGQVASAMGAARSALDFARRQLELVRGHGHARQETETPLHTPKGGLWS